MSSIGSQKSVIEGVRSVKYITAALRDISVLELRDLKEHYSKNAMFYEELQFLYQLVWHIAYRSGDHVQLNGTSHKRLHVAYTTNKHFYGSLNQAVMRRFVQDTDSKDLCVVIGSTGAEYWRSAGKKRKGLTFQSFADDTPTDAEAKEFIRLTEEYGRVFVYYPQFVSVYEQRPGVIDISFRPSKAQQLQHQEIQMPEYFLEPDITEMITFFNAQVRYILFRRVLLETQLSRAAARLLRMDMADHNAAGILRDEQQELRRAYRNFFNSRMLETLTGYAQWHKTTK